MSTYEQYPSIPCRKGRLRGLFALWAACCTLTLPACYEQRQTATINPDGSGKVIIVTRAAVPAVAAPDRGKPSTLEFGRQLAKDFINKTQGVEGWADLSIRQADNGDAVVTATAYFPDVNRLKFDLPLAFSWKREEDGTFRFGIERDRAPARVPPKLTDEELKKQVAEAQARYKEQQPALQTALSTFKVTMTFMLPGDVSDAQVFSLIGAGPGGEGARTVSLTLEGKKLMAALDKFMADDATIAATIRSGNDLLSNDDLLLEAMFGRKGPVAATVHVAPDAAPAFDYPHDAKAALAREAQMLKDAGVETVPTVTVAPATRPATRPR
jgi:hypothetical protein